MSTCPFNILFERNVPHILEIVFLQLDYESFRSCITVNRAWAKLLTSESFKRIGKAQFEEWLLKAVIFGQANAVRHLLRLGAQPDLAVGRSSGKTALHYAALFNKTVIAALLLKAGANPNSRDKCGKSPRYYADAVKAGRSPQYSTYYVLLDSGAKM